jgi:hypothetical protein
MNLRGLWKGETYQRKSHKRHVKYTPCGQVAELLKVKAGGTRIRHGALNN